MLLWHVLLDAARGLGSASCFSPSHRPSPAFACSLGGIAALAREEYFALREEKNPLLERWGEL